jgi:hypothetical protein
MRRDRSDHRLQLTLERPILAVAPALADSGDKRYERRFEIWFTPSGSERDNFSTMRLNGRLLWGLAAIFGGAGSFVLYLNIAMRSLTLGSTALILIAIAAIIVWFLSE